jgi:hypothetical protein
LVVLHFDQKTFGQKDIWSKRHLVKKTFGQKDIWSKRQWVQNVFGQTTGQKVLNVSRENWFRLKDEEP